MAPKKKVTYKRDGFLAKGPGKGRRNAVAGGAGGINPGVASGTWVPSTYRIIEVVTGANTAGAVTDIKLSGNAPFKAYLDTAGEYRLRRLRAVWQPLVSDPKAGTLIAHPYFDDANAGTTLADLFAAGNRMRPVSSSFSTTIQYRQEAQTSSVIVQGGLTFYWATNVSNAATATPGVWTIWIDLDQRGLKPVSAVAIAPVIPIT